MSKVYFLNAAMNESMTSVLSFRISHCKEGQGRSCVCWINTRLFLCQRDALSPRLEVVVAAVVLADVHIYRSYHVREHSGSEGQGL